MLAGRVAGSPMMKMTVCQFIMHANPEQQHDEDTNPDVNDRNPHILPTFRIGVQANEFCDAGPQAV
jgi:hypothetical protein